MPGFNHTTENMKTKTLLGFFLLSVMAFCVSACQDDAEIILFSRPLECAFTPNNQHINI